MPNNIFGQHYISADPYNIIQVENYQFSDTTLPSSLILRPIITNIYKNELKINFRSEIFYNSNAPNLENMGNRFIGRGLSTFNGLNISYFTKYFRFDSDSYTSQANSTRNLCSNC